MYYLPPHLNTKSNMYEDNSDNINSVFVLNHTTMSCIVQKDQFFGTCLEVDHVPEALQISIRHFLLSSTKLTVVDKTGKLLESLRHQQFRLTYRCPDTATNCNDSKHVNRLRTILNYMLLSACVQS